MSSSARITLSTLAAAAALLVAGATLPAAAYDGWGGGYGPGPGYGYGYGRGYEGWRGHHHRPYWERERCWVETRRVRVFTPWGPRFRLVEERVCR